MTEVTFPVNEFFFPPLNHVTATHAVAFQKWGESILQDTLESYHRFQFLTREERDARYKMIKQRGDLTAYRRRRHPKNSNSSGNPSPTSSSHSHSYRSQSVHSPLAASTSASSGGATIRPDDLRYLLVGNIEGTLEEVMFGRYADSTKELRRLNALYRQDHVDSAVLHVFEKRTPEKPFFFSGFKWCVIANPGSRHRDCCYYEQMGIIQDEHGNEIGYSIAESMDLSICPPLSPKCCVRGEVSSCFLYKRNKLGGTKIYLRGKTAANGKMLDFVTDYKCAEMWLRVERSLICARAKVAGLLLSTAHASPPKKASENISSFKCGICNERRFGLLVKSTRCGLCRIAVCSSCSRKHHVIPTTEEPKTLTRTPITKCHFCKRCAGLIQRAPLRDEQELMQYIEDASSYIERRTPMRSVRSYHEDRVSIPSNPTPRHPFSKSRHHVSHEFVTSSQLLMRTASSGTIGSTPNSRMGSLESNTFRESRRRRVGTRHPRSVLNNPSSEMPGSISATDLSYEVLMSKMAKMGLHVEGCPRSNTNPFN